MKRIVFLIALSLIALCIVEAASNTPKKAVSNTPKAIPDSTYTVPAVSPASVQESDTDRVTTWLDTVYTIRCRYVRQRIASHQPKAKPAPTTRGHHLQGWIGAGYGSLGYSLGTAGKETGMPAGKVQLNYAWYFTENWGLAAGVGFSNYCSTGTLNTVKQWDGQTDTDGERYNHIVRTRNWREQQSAYMIDVPVMIQMQYPVAPQWRIYAGAGMKIGFPVAADWRLRSGAIQHEGAYPQWGLTLAGMDKHDFYTEQAASFGQDRHALSLRMPAASVMAEVGIARSLTPELDLMVAVFADYTCNSIRETDKVGDMGWQRHDYSGEDGYRNHTFMPEYDGMVMSEYVSAVRPWAVGIKIGISWHRQPKPKPVKPQYESVLRCDTSFVTRVRVEKEDKPRPVAVQQIVRLMEKSVIWFDLDSTDPKLEPADVLVKIADILKQNPDQKILVYGHASKEGSEQHNQRLSDRRAQVIAEQLIALGVQPEQITRKGFAATVSYEQGEHAISLDRRVEIIPVMDE